MIHAATWLAWATAILIILSSTRNPWYLGLVPAWIAGVSVSIRSENSSAAPIPVSPLRFALIVIAFSAVFNAITVHFGDTVLFTIPEIIPFFGGPVTLEALVFGALNGLVLAGMFAAFTVLNRALPVRAIIRLVPRAFYPVAVVVSIAITFVPVTLRHFQQIRQAQAVRGHRLRGLHDWLPLLMPLLVGGLERALQLAEAMTARGFAGGDASTHDTKTKAAVILGMALLPAGWLLRLVWGQAIAGGILLAAGVGLVVGALWVVGRRVPRTVYRAQPFVRRDWLVLLGACVAVLTFVIPWPGLDRSSIFYYPYPVLTMPTLHPFFLAGSLGLLAPALVAGSR